MARLRTKSAGTARARRVSEREPAQTVGTARGHGEGKAKGGWAVEGEAAELHSKLVQGHLRKAVTRAAKQQAAVAEAEALQRAGKSKKAAATELKISDRTLRRWRARS